MEQTQTQASKGPGAQEILDSLEVRSVLSPEEMDRAAIIARESEGTGLSLLESLVKAGLLSAFQAEALCSGKHAALRIGNYDVLDRVGAGGMGTVFKARHRRMKRIVALKVLSRDLAKEDTFVQRFQREVEVIAGISHPNIVMAYDADEAEAGHFLVMEFIDGQDLASVVQKQGPLTVAVAVDCVLQAARGLAYAHGQGIIHRDIKPANLLRDRSGTVKVTDLGLARFNKQAVGGSPEAGSITQAGSILGTVDYMPPEQAMGSPNIDHRADIYSLGATLHFLLLGRPPYEGESLMATMFKHRLAPIPSLAEARPEVPAALDTIFRRMMAKEPGERFQTMNEVVEALQAIQSQLGSGTTGIGQGAREPLGSAAIVPPPTSATTDQTINLRPGSALAPDFSALKVLLVEPSRTQAAIIRRYLQAQGLQNIAVAGSGEEALNAIDQGHPDAIISTLHLPDMLGVQLVDRIRGEKKTAGPGFVLISSEADGSEAGSLSKYSKAMVLRKPFTPEQLTHALHMVCGQSPSDKTAAGRPVDRSQSRVLIVDDSTPARLHIRKVLTELGLRQFVEAPDGAQAVAAVAQGKFDLIVTDYNMPFMDGRGLVGYLKQNPATASVPIIMVTTETDPEKLDAVRRLGVVVCDKSFPVEEVRRIIDG
jgi:serine/threonine protein kinase/DNA-binding response OmpR family regulator